MHIIQVAGILSCVTAKGGQPEVSAVLAPAEAAYVAGEPVGLTLTITNRGTEATRLFANYPGFNGDGNAGVIIEPFPGGKKTPTAEDLFVGGATAMLDLNPGERLTFRIFLQRFIPEVAIGMNRLAYSITLSCRVSRHGPSNVIVAGRGELEVVVLAGGNRELADAIERQSEGLKSTEYWTNRAAAESIFVTSSPLAVPYIKMAIGQGYLDAGVKALAKFRGIGKAEDLLIGLIRSGKTASLEGELSVLKAWQYALSEADFEGVLARGNTGERVAALRYAREMNDRRYLPAITAYTADWNELVASEAKLSEKVLRAQQ